MQKNTLSQYFDIVSNSEAKKKLARSLAAKPKLVKQEAKLALENKYDLRIISATKKQAKDALKGEFICYASWFKINNFDFDTDSWIILPKIKFKNKLTAKNSSKDHKNSNKSPNYDVTADTILAIVDDSGPFYPVFGKIAKQLTNHVCYYDETTSLSRLDSEAVAISFGLGGYKYEISNKKNKTRRSKLLVKDEPRFLSSIFLGRDLINCPANLQSPEKLANFAKTLAQKHKAKVNVFNKAQIKKLFPLLSAVSDGGREPYFVEINYSALKKANQTPLTINLIGKGITFDTGGLGIKNSANMFLMKKDMGGCANVLALFDMLATNKLPLNLKIYLPITDNSISKNSFRPSDVITASNKTTVEIGHTDAEGRLILADALAYAAKFAKADELMIDFATLTGAARVGLGLEIPNMFGNPDSQCHQIQQMSLELNDPLWHMPLWQGYKGGLSSNIADLSNISSSPYGGAINAALFLQSFIADHNNWIHIDFMGWNKNSRPLHPKGGEVQGIYTIYKYIEKLVEAKCGKVEANS